MSENGKATGGACPSFEEGVNVVAQQAAQNPVPSSLDAAIAVTRLQIIFPWYQYCYATFFGPGCFLESNSMNPTITHISWGCHCSAFPVAIANWAPFRHDGGISTRRPGRDMQIFLGTKWLNTDNWPSKLVLHSSGLGFTLPQAAGAYVPGFGLAISLGGGLPHGASLESLSNFCCCCTCNSWNQTSFYTSPKTGHREAGYSRDTQSTNFDVGWYTSRHGCIPPNCGGQKTLNRPLLWNLTTN